MHNSKLRSWSIAILVIITITTAAVSVYTVSRLKELTTRLHDAEQDVTRLEAAITDKNYDDLLQRRGRLVKASAYSPRACETNGDPWETATQTRATDGRTIAVSRDLAKKHNLLRKRVYIPGLGERVVEDVMHKRYRNSIDVFFESTREAKEFGRQNMVIIPLE